MDNDKISLTMKDILERGKTSLQENRCKGIRIGCYDKQIDKLKYPLKLVSMSFHGTYESCKGKSYSDPHQGFIPTYWDDTDKDIEERYADPAHGCL